MGTITSTAHSTQGTGRNLSSALFTQTQQRVLGLIFGRPQQRFTITDLIALSRAGSGAVQRELAKLVASGLVTVHHVGRQRQYAANPDAPIYDELVSVIRKTVGVAEPLREALKPLASRMTAAFVYGSVAKGRDHAGSDIDLMILSDDLGYADVMHALHPVIELLGRDVNPTLYTLEDFNRRLHDGQAFATRVHGQDTIWLMGDERVLAA